jgi:hypothetical protein
MNMKFLYLDTFTEEEIGVNYMDYIRYDVNEESIKIDSVRSLTKNPRRKFTAFMDGTLRLYKIASAAYTWTPFYVAAISTALLIRDRNKQLRNTIYSRRIYVVLFPFKSYMEFLKKTEGEKIYRHLEIWKIEIYNALKRISRGNFFVESSLEEKTAWSIFKENDSWLISDISFIGIMTTKEQSNKRRYLISEEDLFNPSKVKEAARARARYLMGLLEFYTTVTYLQDNPNGYVMVDGLFYPYKRVKRFFKMERDTYNKYAKNIVGFIKHPRDIPKNILFQVINLKEGDYIHWIGNPSEVEEDEKALNINKITENSNLEKFTFAVLRYRRPFSNFAPSPVGIIKLQTTTKEDIYEAVEAVLYEKYPIPTDRRRLYNESYPIQKAEDVARSNLPSQERMRGYIYSLVQP